MDMRKASELPTREESLESGFTLYGEVGEVYMGPPEDGCAEKGELLGTKVAIKLVEPDVVILSSLIERAYCRSDRHYKRQMRQETKLAVGYINSHNSLKSSTSS